MKEYKVLKNLKTKILVIGDVMVDQYYCGLVNRISPESPVPVFNFLHSYLRAGGAANVAANIASININVSIMSVIGSDYYGDKLKKILEELNICVKYLYEDCSRKTTVKTRLLAQNNQQIIRIDQEDNFNISAQIENILLEMLKSDIEQFDIILVSDYLKGLLTESFLQNVIQICNYSNKKVIIDIKGKNIDKYNGAYLLKPNNKELGEIMMSEISNEKELIEAAKNLKCHTKAKSILVTCGEKGMILIDEDDSIKNVSAVAKEVFDVTGAGDTVLSYLGCCIASNMSLIESAKIANIAAGIKVGKVGTSIVKLEEIENYVNNNLSVNRKIVTVEEYLNIKDKYADKKVVFTNGCFDILHVGHVRYLKKAAELGDILIVGVNSDDSIRKLKGNKRPIIFEKERVEMLASLDCIDYVIVFNKDTPYDLIQTIQPNFLVKGGDYKPEDVVGKDIVEKYDGKVVILPFVEGSSTTDIIEKILSVYDK